MTKNMKGIFFKTSFSYSLSTQVKHYINLINLDFFFPVFLHLTWRKVLKSLN